MAFKWPWSGTCTISITFLTVSPTANPFTPLPPATMASLLFLECARHAPTSGLFYLVFFFFFFFNFMYKERAFCGKVDVLNNPLMKIHLVQLNGTYILHVLTETLAAHWGCISRLDCAGLSTCGKNENPGQIFSMAPVEFWWPILLTLKQWGKRLLT